MCNENFIACADLYVSAGLELYITLMINSTIMIFNPFVTYLNCVVNLIKQLGHCDFERTDKTEEEN